MAMLAVGVGACALPDDESKNRCDVPADCREGLACVGGMCVASSVGGDGDGPMSVTNCPTVACTGIAQCIRSLCAEVFATTPDCDPYAPDDGCPNDAFCLEQPVDVFRCYRFPACPSTGDCPVGPLGGACTGYHLPGKLPMCLPGACADVNDCPVNWQCVRFYPTDAMGQCGDGSPGMPCAGGADCNSNSCNTFFHACN